MAGCPSEDLIAAYVEGSIDAKTRRHIELHLSECAHCRQHCSDLVKLAWTRERASLDTASLTHVERHAHTSALPEPGTTIDRFVVLTPLGSGGMGHVFLAYDQKLSRQVALKLVRSSQHHAKTDAEGRWLAKLSHQHVVAVYDIGEWQSFRYIAMEYIEGTGLLTWLNAHFSPDDWRSRLAVCLKAAEGLEAAHRLGIVHRDIKPSNILCGSHQKVVISDFGLAQDLESNIGVQTRALIGTPRYMSPEQLDRLSVDTRSDQFSLCVTIYEALYGTRPFTGITPDAIRAEIRSQRFAETPSGVNVPRRVRVILQRGLKESPSERFDSVQELIQLLRHTLTSRRLAYAVSFVGVLSLTISLGAVFGRSAYCRMQSKSIEQVYTPAMRGSLLSHFGQDEGSTAVGLRLVELLDEHVAEWRAASESACRGEVRVRSNGLAADQTAQNQCLSLQAAQLGSLIGLLESDQATTPGAALTAVASLAPPRECLSTASALGNGSANSKQIIEAAEVLGRVESLLNLGRLQPALETISQVESFEISEPMARSQLMARALLLKARAQAELSDFSSAEASLREGAHQAALAHPQPLLAEHWIQLGVLLGRELNRASEAKTHAGLTHDLLTQMSADAPLMARFEESRGYVAELEGNYQLAIERHQEAVRLTESEYGSNSARLVQAYSALAHPYRMLGQLDQAQSHYEHSLAIARLNFTSEHPTVVKAMSDLAMLTAVRGEFDKAKTMLAEVIPLARRVFRGDHLTLATALTNLGTIEYELDEYEPARSHFTESFEMETRLLGPDHAHTVSALANLANVDLATDKFHDAETKYRRVLASREKIFGPDHLEMAAVLSNLALVLEKESQCAEAVTLHLRSLKIRQSVTPNHPRIPFVMIALGVCYRELKEYDRSAQYLSDAANLLAEKPTAKAEALFHLAKTHSSRGAAYRLRAVDAANQALVLYRAASSTREADEIVQWMGVTFHRKPQVRP